MIRHGPTTWNAEKRLQGRTDVALSDDGRRSVATWRAPDWASEFDWVASPLGRALETAQALHDGPIGIDDRLIEMSWGAWEGQHLFDIRRELGTAMIENEARGLDFQPPSGESPRMVQNRLRPFLDDVAARGRPHVAVTHRGVMRAMLSLATGWDMKNKAAEEMDRAAAQLFRLGADGRPTVECLNIPLRRTEASV
jgi:probable phosphoglycerate mutase